MAKRIKVPSKSGQRKLPAVDRSVFDDVVHEPVDGQDDMATQLINYDNEHRLAKELEERRSERKRELLGAMKASKTSEVKAETTKEKLTGKLIVSERNSIDAERLKKALGAKLWRKVTTATLDEEKLEAAMKLGEVDPNIVSGCINTTEVEQVRVYRRTK